MRHRTSAVLGSAAFLVLAAVTSGKGLRVGEVRWLSVNADGDSLTGNGFRGFSVSLSSNGRHALFSTWADNIDPSDASDTIKVYVRDLKKNALTRADIAESGASSPVSTYSAVLSGNGRYAAFESDDPDLVSGDDNAQRDVFVRDLKRRGTLLGSVSAGGGLGTGGSLHPTLSDSGRVVAWESEATDLVADDTNGVSDVYVRDLRRKTTIRVSVDSAGAQGNGDSVDPRLSGNGRYLAFESDADNLVADDSNGFYDIFVHDLRSGSTTRVSVSAAGTQADGHSGEAFLSRSGRYVAFSSSATNLVEGDTNARRDVFVHDRKNGTTTRVSVSSDGTQGTESSFAAGISGNGRWVCFRSSAPSLVTDDTNARQDLFLHDRKTGVTARVALTAAGAQIPLGISGGTIAGNGKTIGFQQDDDGVVPDDTNGARDAFVRRLR